MSAVQTPDFASDHESEAKMTAKDKRQLEQMRLKNTNKILTIEENFNEDNESDEE